MNDTPTFDAEKFKQDTIAAAQQALIDKLQGDKKTYSWQERGKDAPESYDELFAEVKKNVPTLSQEDIDARVEAKLQERESARVEAEKIVKEQQTTDMEARRKNFDKEWYELVSEGKMPKVGQEVQDRINKGESLTTAEINADEGLKARLELAQVAQTKSAKLAFYEDYNKEPAGARAPVLGSRPSTPQTESKELDYEDIKKNRKRAFGF